MNSYVQIMFMFFLSSKLIFLILNSCFILCTHGLIFSKNRHNMLSALYNEPGKVTWHLQSIQCLGLVFVKKLMAASEKHTAQQARKSNLRVHQIFFRTKYIWLENMPHSPSTSNSTSITPSRKMIVEKNHKEDDPQKTACTLTSANLNSNPNFNLTCNSQTFSNIANFQHQQHHKMMHPEVISDACQFNAKPFQYHYLPTSATSQDDAPREHLR